jgi:hypothetical protein
VINGSKMWITGAGHANWFFVLAKTEYVFNIFPRMLDRSKMHERLDYWLVHINNLRTKKYFHLSSYPSNGFFNFKNDVCVARQPRRGKHLLDLSWMPIHLESPLERRRTTWDNGKILVSLILFHESFTQYWHCQRSCIVVLVIIQISTA